jgi:hypothetical protein
MIAWTFLDGRSTEIATALGGEARSYFDLSILSRRLMPARYLLSALRTAGHLALTRPRSVIATNPPVLPGLIAWVYGRLSRAGVVLDSHPSSFDPGVHAGLARQLPLHKWLTSRVDATIITGAELADLVSSWGGRPIVVHEAPPSWTVEPPGAIHEPPRVLVLGALAADEPVAEVLAAARELPGVNFRVTGDPRRIESRLRASAAANTEFTGYLRGAAYVQALAEADVVLSLTRRPEAVSRATYEGVYALRPVVTSQSELTDRLFPHAIRVANDKDSIAAGVKEAIVRHHELVGVSQTARKLQQDRVASQLDDLRAVLGIGTNADAYPTPDRQDVPIRGSR